MQRVDYLPKARSISQVRDLTWKDRKSSQHFRLFLFYGTAPPFTIKHLLVWFLKGMFLCNCLIPSIIRFQTNPSGVPELISSVQLIELDVYTGQVGWGPEEPDLVGSPGRGVGIR